MPNINSMVLPVNKVLSVAATFTLPVNGRKRHPAALISRPDTAPAAKRRWERSDGGNLQTLSDTPQRRVVVLAAGVLITLAEALRPRVAAAERRR